MRLTAPTPTRIAGIVAALVGFAAFLGLGMIKGFWVGEFPLDEPTHPLRKGEESHREMLPGQYPEAGATVGEPTQILFGDLHVHTSISLDAFQMTMPLAAGEGVHPVSDACDFARFCSGLDFFSINDHAENVTRILWQNTKESIRQCDALSDQRDPDLVAFLGFEWTQVGANPDNHYGHKNVVFLETADDAVPTHPVASKPPRGGLSENDFLPGLDQKLLLPLVDLRNFFTYMAFNRYAADVSGFAGNPCPVGTPYPELKEQCMAQAKTPAQLFELLSGWGGESIVIPHGNTWGNYTPMGVTWDKQLRDGLHDIDRQSLFEIFSGHGNSEPYRSWRHVTFNDRGEKQCPPETADFYPGCRRAGDIVLERCRLERRPDEECLQLSEKARQDFLDSVDREAFMSIPSASAADWQDSGQCRDCFLPTYGTRPGGSAQYALAIRDFSDPENPRRFHFGFIGSSDNHYARPGTGYKEFSRSGMTEAWSSQLPEIKKRLVGEVSDEGRVSSRAWRAASKREAMMAGVRAFERQASFFYTGGLVAVHASDRTREEIWKALKSRRVYATSGDRTLLWFDLLSAGDHSSSVVPMGGQATTTNNPRFRVRAAGAFKQEPGCPDYSLNSLSADEVERLCHGECYNPSDQRSLITRIEVVRIRPQNHQDESVDQLIEDRWKVFECPVDESGCVFEFEDPEFSTSRRDAVYYVRAIGEPKPLINGQTQNYEYDQAGNYVGMSPCNTLGDDDCLGVDEPRAWSSPIFVAYGRGE